MIFFYHYLIAIMFCIISLILFFLLIACLFRCFFQLLRDSYSTGNDIHSVKVADFHADAAGGADILIDDMQFFSFHR